MYQQHFGLSKRPFPANAVKAEVFVGPQTATAMAALKKALSTSDAVAVVSGPVGVGKTTIVNRALESTGSSRIIVSIGRMRLGHDEVLELLLQGLGMHEPPTGTLQRLKAFRRLLQEFAQKGTRVFVVVEDALRIGANTLSELEAVTAVDAGESDGANIVLMGDAEIDQLLRHPELARLKQRIRLRQPIQRLSAAELLAYLKHSFRLAGTEFDSVFATGVADTLHRLSGGIPRIANGLIESALTSAAETKQKQITVELIERIAVDEFGLTDKHRVKEIEQVIDKAELQSAEPKASVAKVSEAAETPEPVKAPVSQTVAATVEDAIPELIQDTLPDLKILAPNLANPPSSQNKDADGSAVEAPSDDTGDDEVPEWERDPTLAQLRPDLDALERAMSVAQGTDEAEDEQDNAADASDPANPPKVVPEITLDRQIEAKVAKATEELKKSRPATSEDQSAEASNEEASSDTAATSTELPILTPPTVTGKPDVATAEKAKEPSAADTKKDDKLDAIAVGLAKAKTIDDVDDMLAETLFGEEFSMIAAQVVAKAQENASANDELQIELEVPAVAAAAATPEIADVSAVSKSSELPPSEPDTKPKFSVTQRLATVRALNDNTAPARVAPAQSAAPSAIPATTPVPPPSAAPEPAPEPDLPQSFEQQINTSMTQTLKALKVSPHPVHSDNDDDDDDDDDNEGGFMGLFRRS